MNIKITRYQRSGQSIDGHLTIDEGLRLCDTAENRFSALSEGVYPIRIVKCKQYCRKMICLTPEPPCQQCDKIAEVSGNTQRIRKSAARGHDLTLEIEEAYPPEKRPPTLYEACQDWLKRIEHT